MADRERRQTLREKVWKQLSHGPSGDVLEWESATFATAVADVSTDELLNLVRPLTDERGPSFYSRAVLSLLLSHNDERIVPALAEDAARLFADPQGFRHAQQKDSWLKWFLDAWTAEAEKRPDDWLVPILDASFPPLAQLAGKLLQARKWKPDTIDRAVAWLLTGCGPGKEWKPAAEAIRAFRKRIEIHPQQVSNGLLACEEAAVATVSELLESTAMSDSSRETLFSTVAVRQDRHWTQLWDRIIGTMPVGTQLAGALAQTRRDPKLMSEAAIEVLIRQQRLEGLSYGERSARVLYKHSTDLGRATWSLEQCDLLGEARIPYLLDLMEGAEIPLPARIGAVDRLARFRVPHPEELSRLECTYLVAPPGLRLKLAHTLHAIPTWQAERPDQVSILLAASPAAAAKAAVRIGDNGIAAVAESLPSLNHADAVNCVACLLAESGGKASAAPAFAHISADIRRRLPILHRLSEHADGTVEFILQDERIAMNQLVLVLEAFEPELAATLCKSLLRVAAREAVAQCFAAVKRKYFRRIDRGSRKVVEESTAEAVIGRAALELAKAVAEVNDDDLEKLESSPDCPVECTEFYPGSTTTEPYVWSDSFAPSAIRAVATTERQRRRAAR